MKENTSFKDYTAPRPRPKEMTPKEKMRHRAMLVQVGLHKGPLRSPLEQSTRLNSPSRRSKILIQSPTKIRSPASPGSKLRSATQSKITFTNSRLQSPRNRARSSPNQGIAYIGSKTPRPSSPKVPPSATVKFDSGEDRLARAQERKASMDHRNYPLPRPFYHRMPGVVFGGESALKIRKTTPQTKESIMDTKKINSKSKTTQMSAVSKQKSSLPANNTAKSKTTQMPAVRKQQSNLPANNNPKSNTTIDNFEWNPITQEAKEEGNKEN